MGIFPNGTVGIGTGSPGGALGVETGNEVAGWFENNSDNFNLPTLVALNAAPVGDADAYAFLAGAVVGTAIQTVCEIESNGNLYCNGSKSAVVPVDGGSREVALYAVEAPENWFEDYGSGQLSNGSARIDLEPTFAQTVNTDLDYHVFVTPRGECEGLYVTNLTRSGFEVRELHHGSSTVAFDYRIIAKRKNYENVRLADRTEQDRKLTARLATTRQHRHEPTMSIATGPQSLIPANETPAVPKSRQQSSAPTRTVSAMAPGVR